MRRRGLRWSGHLNISASFLRSAVVRCGCYWTHLHRINPTALTATLVKDCFSYRNPFNLHTSTGPYRSCAAQLSKSNPILSCEFVCGLVSLSLDLDGWDKHTHTKKWFFSESLVWLDMFDHFCLDMVGLVLTEFV